MQFGDTRSERGCLTVWNLWGVLVEKLVLNKIQKGIFVTIPAPPQESCPSG